MVSLFVSNDFHFSFSHLCKVDNEVLLVREIGTRNYIMDDVKHWHCSQGYYEEEHVDHEPIAYETIDGLQLHQFHSYGSFERTQMCS